jgi:hypothetical protein
MEPTIVGDYHEWAQVGVEHFTPVALAETDRLKVVLTCFEAGQLIPLHSPGVDMALVILEGTATAVAGGCRSAGRPRCYRRRSSGRVKGSEGQHARGGRPRRLATARRS